MYWAKRICTNIILLLFEASLFAIDNVDFYGTVSSSSDTNMIKMTTDLFFTQFQSLEGYAVSDKREQKYADSVVAKNLSFYIEVQENESNGWECTLNIIKPVDKKTISVSKTYDSYYKILLDAKDSLAKLIENMKNNIQSQSPPQTSEKNKTPSPNAQEEQVSLTDIIAGTWLGEKYIEKIIILRGGRGFIIYKNGASMNISVKVTDTKVQIRQIGKFNASFYPELDRETALQNAENASPIEYNLELADEKTLQGTKTTFSDSTHITWIRR